MAGRPVSHGAAYPQLESVDGERPWSGPRLGKVGFGGDVFMSMPPMPFERQGRAGTSMSPRYRARVLVQNLPTLIIANMRYWLHAA